MFSLSELIVVTGHFCHSILWVGYIPSGVESTSEKTSVAPEGLCSATEKRAITHTQLSGIGGSRPGQARALPG